MFSVLYFSVMGMDLVVMFIPDVEFLRLFTKPSLLLLLILYYSSNDDESVSKDFVFTILALSFFLVANLATYFYQEPLLIMTASICFILGKIFYICRFSNGKGFNIVNFLPFLASYLLYIFVILNLTLDNLGSSLIPILLFLFVTYLAVQFALLRKGTVSKSSYQLVIFGMVTLMLSDTLSVLGAFHRYWPWERFLTMMFYATAQYLLVMGLVKEKKEPMDTRYA